MVTRYVSTLLVVSGYYATMNLEVSTGRLANESLALLEAVLGYERVSNAYSRRASQ